MLDVYAINLDRSTERWARLARAFSAVPELQLHRVSAIDVQQQPQYAKPPYFHAYGFRLRMGRAARGGEIGCYASHLLAMRQFLETQTEFALICEDDVQPTPELPAVLAALTACADRWELVRLTRCRTRGFYPWKNLPAGHTLGTNLHGLSFAAAYLLNRQGAERLLKHLAGMRLPYDLALYYGWPDVREASVLPDALTLDALSEETTLGKKKPHTLSDWLFVPSKILYKIHMRLHRRHLQGRHVQERLRD